ncbi:MAG: RsmE family RNA methyltransferase [Spirochaetales bacterium]
MNLVLFEPGELPGTLDRRDPRALHLLEILKLVPGDRFVAGEVEGRKGTAALLSVGASGLAVGEQEFTLEPPALLEIRLLIGTPRPPTARRLLKDLTTLGACELHFVATDLGDKSYLQSTLWKGEWRNALKEGAAQNRGTRLPQVERHQRLSTALSLISSGRRVCFREQAAPWTSHPVLTQNGPLWLAIGPERGWSDREQLSFETAGWSSASLGTSVLRTETACSLALGIAALGFGGLTGP